MKTNYTANKHILKKWLLLSGLALGLNLTACNKMLDIKPKDQLDQSEIFTSVDKLNLGVLGVYANWDEENSIRIGSVMADECRIGSQNAGVDGSGQNMFRWAFSSSDNEIKTPWQQAYQTIDRANRILDGIDNVPTKGDDDIATKKHLKGELLAIRAYAHFDLYRNYGYSGIYDAMALAVPYITNSSTNNQPSRPKSAEFFASLWKDLMDAETLMDNSASPTRMSLTAVYALHARAALYIARNDEAITYASKTINIVPLATQKEFPSIWTDQSNAEVIFKLKRTNRNQIRPGDIWFNLGANRLLFAPSTKLLNKYNPDSDIRYTSYFSDVDDGQFKKGIGKYAGTEGAKNLNDVKVFRTAEMYLIRAEAYVTTNNLIAAQNDLNTLRANRISNYINESFSTQKALTDAILNERFKELAFEGHRYFDLKRLGMPIERNTDDLEAGSTQKELQPSDLYYYLPIPQAEVLANPNIKPNNRGW